ncbi:MAG TPA: glycosyltransferase [Candidatus Nitrosotalea sp.]|nr:glycosyltransferase [Candidatus Nitrosotalea sp.]
MKILHAGNIANLGYFIANPLRREGVEIDLLMENHPPPEQDPLKYDPTLQNKYPDWIIFYDRKSYWKQILRVMKDRRYDLIHAHYDLAIFGHLSMRKLVSHVVGTDLRKLAFSHSIRGHLLRNAYKNSEVVIFQTPSEPPLLEKLGIQQGIFVPFPTDVTFYAPQEMPQRQFHQELVVFHPTNLNWEKGNEILVRGYAEFVRSNPNSLLLIVDRGEDSAKIHALVDSLEIEDKTTFIKGPLNSVELRKYYNLVDVVADQFLVPDIGSVGRETLCAEKPLLSFCDKDGYKDLYGESPPVASATTPSEVAGQLERLKDEKLRREIGREGRRWMVKYHSQQAVARRIRAIYEGILSGKKIQQIREDLPKISS